MNSITACDLAERLTANKESIVCGRPGQNQSLFILDCRPSPAFENLHIKTSINVTFPSILYKRLLKGTLSPQSIIPTSSVTARNHFAENYKQSSIVLVDDNDRDSRHRRKSTDETTINVYRNHGSSECCHHSWVPTASTLLYEKLRNENCDVCYVEGGISNFAESYPNLCQSSTQAEHFHLRISSEDDRLDKIEKHSKDGYQQNSSSSHLDMNSLHLVDSRLQDSAVSLSSSENVRSVESCCSRSTASNDSVYSDADINLIGSSTSITNAMEDYSKESNKNSNSDHNLHMSTKEQHEIDVNDENDPKNGHCRPLDSRFPVEIISNLFLGNSSNSADKETLLKCNIKYILNVTPDLPNVFENDPDFRYLKLPIYDHWSQDLLIHFPSAISFIDEARQKNCGVLVHCLAGISRSVTVTVAYLMRTLSLSLEDAYDLVKDHKPNIAPNLNFMGQLLHFQRDLYGENVPFNRRKRGSDQWSVDDYKQSNEPYIFTPLSAPPQRRDGRGGAKNFAECF